MNRSFGSLEVSLHCSEAGKSEGPWPQKRVKGKAPQQGSTGAGRGSPGWQRAASVHVVCTLEAQHRPWFSLEPPGVPLEEVCYLLSCSVVGS